MSGRASTAFGGAQRAQEVREAPHAAPQEAVVVVTARIAGDAARQLAVVVVARVAACHAHYASGAGQDLVSIESRSCDGVLGQPAHLAVHSRANEGLVAGKILVD
jgi:hypothetical protein